MAEVDKASGQGLTGIYRHFSIIRCTVQLRGEVSSADPVGNSAIKFLCDFAILCHLQLTNVLWKMPRPLAKNGSLLNKDRKVHIFVKTLIRSL